MNFPDFEDFIQTLDEETISAIFHDANAKSAEVLKIGGIDTSSVCGLQIQSIGFTLALELLAAYHKWISQQP